MHAEKREQYPGKCLCHASVWKTGGKPISCARSLSTYRAPETQLSSAGKRSRGFRDGLEGFSCLTHFLMVFISFKNTSYRILNPFSARSRTRNICQDLRIEDSRSWTRMTGRNETVCISGLLELWYIKPASGETLRPVCLPSTAQYSASSRAPAPLLLS